MELKLGEAACNYMQVLPDSTPGHEASTTLTALNKAVDAALGLGPNAARELRKMGQHLRTYRQSTKALIHALRNALQVLLPGYNFRSSIPDVLLRPCGSMIRYPLSDAEKELMNIPQNLNVFFLWDPEKAAAHQDFYPATQRHIVRLVLSADEGSEGFLMWQHLATEGVHVMFWNDTSHKIHRKQSNAIANVPEAQALMRKLVKVFRTSRAPFDSSRFGQMRLDARMRMLSAMQEAGDCSTLEAVTVGVARDHNLNVADMSPTTTLRCLLDNAGPLLA